MTNSKPKQPVSPGAAISIVIIFIFIFLIFKCSCNEPKSTNLEPIETETTNESVENSPFQEASEPTIEQTNIEETEDNAPIVDNETITTAQKLATLDSDSPEPIQIHDYRVMEIQKHLYRLSKTFKLPENRIGEITYKTSLQFKDKKGLNYSTLDLLRVADKDLDTYKDSGVKYEEFMALIFVMTEE